MRPKSDREEKLKSYTINSIISHFYVEQKILSQSLKSLLLKIENLS